MVINRLAKVVHFLVVKATFTFEQLVDSCIEGIVAVHGVQLILVLGLNIWFISKFYYGFQETTGNKLHLSTSFLPWSNGITKRTIQTLYMLMTCAVDSMGSWHHNLRQVEFG